MPARQDQQLGLGLVEMLVTALIGGILLVSIATAISAMTQTQNRIDEYERLQESLRFVIHLAGRSLRTAEELIEAQDNHLTIQRRAEKNGVLACTGKEMSRGKKWTERFALEQGQLRCRVEQTGYAVTTETLAYDLAELGWRYAVYNVENEAQWVSADEITDPTAVIGVQMMIQFAESAVQQANRQHQPALLHHQRVLVLRHALARQLDSSD